MSTKDIKTLQVSYLPVEKIKRYEGNPKLHSPKQVEQIRKSIDAFGFLNPILLDEKNEIIAGHGRLEAALLAGIEIEPVYVDTAIRRYEEVFKKDAIHVKTGKTYKELLAQKKEVK